MLRGEENDNFFYLSISTKEGAFSLEYKHLYIIIRTNHENQGIQ